MALDGQDVEVLLLLAHLRRVQGKQPLLLPVVPDGHMEPDPAALEPEHHPAVTLHPRMRLPHLRVVVDVGHHFKDFLPTSVLHPPPVDGCPLV